MPEDTTPLTADADVPVMPDGYDPEAAARLMWWATTGCYARFKPDVLQIGVGRLAGRAMLHGSRELLLIQEGQDVFIVFRGTTSFSDVVSDISVLQIPPGDGHGEVDDSYATSILSMLKPWTPRMHRGFAKRSMTHLDVIIDLLRSTFDNDLRQIKRIYVTGHSLGGAAAMGCAYMLNRWQENLKTGAKFTFEKGFEEGVEYDKDSHPGMVFDDKLEMAVYSFSGPRLGNFALKTDYEERIPNSFNHVYHWDLIALMGIWAFTCGWQIHAVPSTLKLLGMEKRTDYFRPSKWMGVLLNMHTSKNLVLAFLSFFYALGASDKGWDDVKHHMTGFYENSSHQEKFVYAKSHPSEASPHKHGSDIKIEIRPPGFHSALVFKRIHQALLGIWTVFFFVPLSLLGTWHVLMGLYMMWEGYSHTLLAFAGTLIVIFLTNVLAEMIWAAYYPRRATRAAPSSLMA